MHHLSCALLAILVGFTAFAQSSEINFSRITVEQGLSQSTVKAIIKDSRGYMWFGTRDGLNRYDGYTTKVFRRKHGRLNLYFGAVGAKGRVRMVGSCGFVACRQ